MGLDEFLAGMKPESNDEYDQLDGTYKAVINSLTAEVNKFTEQPQYRMEVQIVEVLDGNGSPGRRLWKRYSKDEDGIKQLVNDLFTAGIDTNLAHGMAGFEESLANTVGKTLFIRAVTNTPSKTKDGTEIPEGDRRTYQNVYVTSEKRLKKLIERAEASPF